MQCNILYFVPLPALMSNISFNLKKKVFTFKDVEQYPYLPKADHQPMSSI